MRNITDSPSLRGLFDMILVAALFAVTSSTFAQNIDMESTYNQTIKQALQANEKVLKLEYQWTTVPELLKQAKAAAKRKDFNSANNYAAEALKHAELGIQQAQQQAQVWENAVPHK